MSQRKREACLTLQGETLVTRRHIRLRPTKLSLVMLALSAAVWVGAANYQVNVAYAVCFWVIGFIGVSALLTQRQLMGMKVQAACRKMRRWCIRANRNCNYRVMKQGKSNCPTAAA